MNCERCGREYCDPQSFIADEAECYRLGFERLSIENTSLMESLRAAREEMDEEKARANRMLQLATSLLGIPEKTPDCSLCGAWSAGKPLCVDCAAARLAAAEQRNTALEGALRDLRQQVEDTIMVAQTDVDADDFITAYHFKTGAIHRLLAKARDLIPGAALHDEERSAAQGEEK